VNSYLILINIARPWIIRNNHRISSEYPLFSIFTATISILTGERDSLPPMITTLVILLLKYDFKTTQANQSLSDEQNFRPRTMKEFIGHDDLKNLLRLRLDPTYQRSASLVLLVVFDGPSFGITTLAAIIASEKDTNIH
jgi:Holliday junction DNA helicase RuvB P-loop domain